MPVLADEGPRRAAPPHWLDGPEGALLARLIGLPDGVDPARAAQEVLASMQPPEQDGAGQSRLRALLAEVCQNPADAPARRRRANLRR